MGLPAFRAAALPMAQRSGMQSLRPLPTWRLAPMFALRLRCHATLPCGNALHWSPFKSNGSLQTATTSQDGTSHSQHIPLPVDRLQRQRLGVQSSTSCTENDARAWLRRHLRLIYSVCLIARAAAATAISYVMPTLCGGARLSAHSIGDARRYRHWQQKEMKRHILMRCAAVGCVCAAVLSVVYSMLMAHQLSLNGLPCLKMVENGKFSHRTWYRHTQHVNKGTSAPARV